MDEIPLAS